jgi:hypothetical protein
MQNNLHLKTHSSSDDAIYTAALLRTLFAYWHRKIKGASVYPGTQHTALMALLGYELRVIFRIYLKAVLTNPQRT